MTTSSSNTLNNMSNSPLVSVVVPVYNAEKYLGNCLKSIMSQEYTNLEIVIVDDGSTDKSKNIIDRFALSDNRIVAFHQKNCGVSNARNKGMELAKGKFVAFIDADDIIHKTYIFNLVCDLNESGADIVTTSASVMSISESDFLSISHEKIATYTEYAPTQALVALYKGTLENGLNGQQMFRYSFIKKYNLKYDATMTICEDFDYLARAIIKSNKVVVDNRCMYFYRANEASALHTATFIQHYESIFNKQAAGRSVELQIPEITNTLDDNILVESISCAALNLDARKTYPTEYKQIIVNINKYRYKTFFRIKLKLKDRIKVLVVVIFGVNLGLRIINMLNKMKDK